MSKQSDAKKQQGYVDKAVPTVCMNCIHFRSELVDKNAEYRRQNPGTSCGEFWADTNMRCTVGGFAVKKMGTCSFFSWKAQV